MILVRFTGGLGNQMFQYAFANSVALKHNVPLKFDDSLLGGDAKVKDLVVRHFDLDVFQLQEEWASKDEIAAFNGYSEPNVRQRILFKINRLTKKYPLVIQNGHEYNQNQINEIDGNACIIGRWQSESFFKEYSSEIKKTFDFSHFKPNDYSCEVAERMKSNISVSVQVRRGDYVTHSLYAKQIGALNKQYYIDAMQLMRSKLPLDDKCTFYFISDDIQWCKENFGDLENVVFVNQEKSKNGYISDLWLLTQSKHSIISNSTFSWWGAWLGEAADSNIIAPKNWLRQTDPNANLFVPQRWITIDNKFEPLIS